jgi:tRNA (cmo5U34)-methyltransferase
LNRKSNAVANADASIKTPVPEHLKGAVAEGYAERGPRWFIPGYDASHAMAAVLLTDRIGPSGRILVVGAGGGVELSVFAQESTGWHFTAVDPSPDMLAGAKRAVAAAGATDRVSFAEGYVDDVAETGFDAATALLALHFVPDDGRRLRTMQEIHARLKPGGAFLLINGCADTRSPTHDEDVRLYAAFARRSGAPSDLVEMAVEMLKTSVFMLPPEREEALLCEAGFREARRFYAAFWFKGWIARA